MSSKDKVELFWQLAPYLLAILSYLIGKARNLLRVPKPAAQFLANPDVMRIIQEGVEKAGALQGRSDTEKREFVLAWARMEIYKLLGDWLPNSAINLLIEVVINRKKAER